MMHRRTLLRAGTAALAGPVALNALAGGTAHAVPLPVQGVDLSSVLKAEDLGAVWRYSDNTVGDPLRILQEGGANWVRLKVWVDSPDGYHGKQQVLTMAQRANALGMRLLIDFHYSDSWADPGQQRKPAAWAGLSGGALEQALYDHTFDVLDGLRGQGTAASMVQIGNEINGGMLWPDGSTDDWDALAGLLTAGARATADASPGTEIALHLAEGGDNGGTVWWFDNAVARGVPFDVIALSFYIYWHGTLDELQINMNDVAARYGKDVIVAETAYPFTLDDADGHPNIIADSSLLPDDFHPTVEGQAAWMGALSEVVASVPGGRGRGMFYWEPAWTATPGNGWDPADPSSGNAWENQALFDFTGRALPAARWR
ncbi:glycoside hydrolase family 53 protein [Streptomyces johnsoniae]|uniref:Arabinogalactan endo-beta-1,4-galactanase n=1 Tax=Streptomyces johnsoniae TaxID=3075532 RepID=A0ABU2SAH9_9ACTN|nr:arabinogalactan endo-1,4-beta-galactosidase [Streptomyces sp. DSM 41886]MDT0444839.1 arabinogalactan endo-1,4-beta-galactosidase [Streptomyces sp. DSM 41886]